ncbi:MAG: hypothetical protein NVS2B3_18670 [Vulcanimicrobiaceae bacterium]
MTCDRRNLVPLPYRNVSVQRYDGPMTPASIAAHLVGREAYRRTEFVVLRAGEGDDPAIATAVVAIRKRDPEPFFSEILDVEVLALPETTTFAVAPETDVANPSALAAVARTHGVGVEGTMVVWGRYDHVNFIHHPDPIVVRVIEVSPPEPPKLYDMVEHVLSYANLPPVQVELERIDLRALCATVTPHAYLVPCRSGGLDDLGAPVYFLDQRPPTREDWTLVGCERSSQFHRHYYGDEPPRVEMCPRRLAAGHTERCLVKCCLLEFHTERDGNVGVVPWGSDLAMVERALVDLVTAHAYV